MILAKVLTGDSYYCHPGSSLRMPPKKQVSPRMSPEVSPRSPFMRQVSPRMSTEKQASLGGVRYDSVNGETKGSQVFMTYTNNQAYPAYIITYM